MVAKTITYEDYNGVERKETFYFHLNKAEVMELEFENSGGLAKLLQKIIDEKDSKRIIEWFKKIILMAYGEKTLDGRQFKKSDELSKAFSETAAYPELFMELAFDAEKASEFVNGIIPNDMKKEAAANNMRIAASN